MEELKIPYKILSEATIRTEKLVLKGQKHKGILYASLYISLYTMCKCCTSIHKTIYFHGTNFVVLYIGTSK